MEKNIDQFQKKKSFLICVDSDGCAMDTMDSKHKYCFGPEASKAYGMESHNDLFLELWDKVNLYSMTRGINRFKGLVLTLEQIKDAGVQVIPFDKLAKWVETAEELSNPALEKLVTKTKDSQYITALEWSKATNKAIVELKVEGGPFPGVEDGLSVISQVADVAIVSSANGAAVEQEWEEFKLSPYVNIMFGQEAGSKVACINNMKRFHYGSDAILMVGDAPGDLDAAVSNEVLYYPILVGKEAFSWKRLKNEALGKLVDGTFQGDYQEQLKKEFYENLK